MTTPTIELENFIPSAYPTAKNFILALSEDSNLHLAHIEVWYEWWLNNQVANIANTRNEIITQLADTLVKTINDRDKFRACYMSYFQ